MKRDYIRADHCVYHCDYHLVFVTKYRRNVIANEGIWTYLEQKLREVTEHYPRIRIKEINHDINHIHILISIPPQMSVGSVVRLLKTNSSRNIKSKFPFLKKVYYGTDGMWSDGYFVSSVGADEETIKRYIEKQGEEDIGQTATLFE
ncbi:TPA: IS200/IS605 family transposase [Candidatus Nomurabacteria bacterium]|nr:IS200/IS605 family transposase [Candidatus Nomurabacteria bacterium]